MNPNSTASLSLEGARDWLSRWDTQQDRYIERREERFAVIGDLLAATCRADAKILDLACGPGSLGARLAERFPKAQVVGVDYDPVLLAIARTAHREDPRRRFLESDLRLSGWWKDEAPASFDAVVSTTALHWLGSHELVRVYREAARLLRPGGVLVNGDHVAPAPGEQALARVVARSREQMHVEADARGAATWEGWWDAIAHDATFAGAWEERGRRFGARHGEEPITLAYHLAALRQAGFEETGVAWQRWDDVVMFGTVAGRA
ncbi:class I SAM-dependent methyltransferase [Pendulispora albinea]|uniref:Class I SAM-dependent methyltransferase n=1 Tax=Pendulispora albinea TaxID=2741071 RepID=A0ABZ2LPL1_9BACT